MIIGADIINSQVHLDREVGNKMRKLKQACWGQCLLLSCLGIPVKLLERTLVCGPLVLS